MTDRFRQDLVALVPRLRRFALSLTGNAADADDLVQSACVKALKNAHQFREGTRMRAFLPTRTMIHPRPAGAAAEK